MEMARSVERFVMDESDVLKRRPDHLVVQFRASTKAKSLGEEIRALEVFAESQRAGLSALFPGSKMCLRDAGVIQGKGKISKSIKSEKRLDGERVRVSGELLVPLTSASYWARARTFVELYTTLDEAAKAAEKSKPKISLTFTEIKALVRDPEVYRQELLELWKAKLEEVMALLPQGVGPARIPEVKPLGRVCQRAIDLETVALSLEISLPLDCALQPKAEEGGQT